MGEEIITEGKHMKIKVNDIEITLTQEQIKEIAEGYTPEPDKIELSGGEHHIDMYGSIINYPNRAITRNFGTEFKTEKLAKHVSKEMRITNRIRARAYEIDPDFRDEIGRLTCLIYVNDENYWTSNWHKTTRSAGAIYMSESTAKQLCDELNSGRFDPRGE